MMTKPALRKACAPRVLDGLERRFRRAAAPAVAEAEAFLERNEVPFRRCRDGRLLVPGNLVVRDIPGETLPDLSRVVVLGDLDIDYNNKIHSLKGCPQEVGGEFTCFANPELETLEGGPVFVGGAFVCLYNGIVSLRGAPRYVGGRMSCTEEKLVSLVGAPLYVGEGSFVESALLKTMSGLRKKNFPLNGSFGIFETRGDVPESLRAKSKEALSRLERGRAARRQHAIERTYKLDEPVEVFPPLKFKPKPA